MSCAADFSLASLRTLARLPARLYEFPTGYNTGFGVDRFRLPEILFNPTLVSHKATMEVDDGLDQMRAATKHMSIQKMVLESITKCDPDHRFNLFQSILVTGGTTMFNGFPERLFHELSYVASQYKTKIIAPTNFNERRFSSWIGGSILTSLGSFHQMWISKAEYEETGKTVVEKKCP